MTEQVAFQDYQIRLQNGSTFIQLLRNGSLCALLRCQYQFDPKSTTCMRCFTKHITKVAGGDTNE